MLRETQGRIVYPNSDAYLRLAMAKNMALAGSWGVNAGQFASVSGSLLWPLLLAVLFRLFGVYDSIPLILNLLLAVVLVGVASRIARRSISSPTLGWLALVLFIIVVPLAPLALEGMEQVLFLLLVLLFAEQLVAFLGEAQTGRLPVLYVLGVALASTRYEGLLLVGVGCVLLIWKGKFRIAAGLAVFAAVPAVVYGVISLHYGWYPVPNTVYFRRAKLAPSSLRDVPTILLRVFDVLDGRPDLRAVVLVPLLALAWQSLAGRVTSFRDIRFQGVVLALLTVIVHITLVGGRSYAYDAYLVELEWWASLPLVGQLEGLRAAQEPSRPNISILAASLLGLLLLFPPINRGVTAMLQTPGAAREVFDEQDQLARLAMKCTPGSAVAGDDVGMLAYKGIRAVDLTGVFGMDLARARRAGTLTPSDLGRVANMAGIELAFVRDPAVRELVPSAWKSLGTWVVSDCVQCNETGVGGITTDTTELYSAKPQDVSRLATCLSNFDLASPSGVTLRP
jgi:hypothetical protein